jgi:hypothetical protein
MPRFNLEKIKDPKWTAVLSAIAGVVVTTLVFTALELATRGTEDGGARRGFWITPAATEPAHADSSTVSDGCGDVIYWTNIKPDYHEIADKYRMFIGPIDSRISQIILSRNPTATLLQYYSPRYFHPYQTTLWTEYCRKRGLDPEMGYLHRSDGSRVIPPETGTFGGWGLANLENEHYRNFALDEAFNVGKPGYVSGVLYDTPVRVVAWEDYGGVAETTAENYDRACVEYISAIQKLTGKMVMVNASSLWWYERAKPELRDVMRDAVKAGEGVMFEAGGAWTFGELRDKQIVITHQPSNVFVGIAHDSASE